MRFSIVFLLSACSVGASMDGHVDKAVKNAPTTIAEAEAFANKRGLALVREPFRRPKVNSGGSGCAHSPVCLILLPVIAYNSLSHLVPTGLEMASVTENETIVFAGLFDLRGRLVSGRLKAGAQYRNLKRLDLDQLGIHPIVEVSQSDIDGGGAVATPLLPQIDLDHRYEKAIAEAKKSSEIVALWTEFLAAARPEALLVFTAHYDREPSLDDDEVARLQTSLCKDSELSPYMQRLALRAKDKSARAVLLCATAPTAQFAAAYLPELGRAYCQQDARENLAVFERVTALQRVALPKDCPAARASLLNWKLAGSIDEAALRSGLADKEDGELLFAEIDVDNAMHFRALLGAMHKRSVPGHWVRALHQRKTPPSESELELVRAWLKSDDANVVGHAFVRLLQARPQAKKIAGGQLGKDTSMQAALRIALVRDHELLAKAAKAVWLVTAMSEERAVKMDAWNEKEVIVFALLHSGCTLAEIEAAAKPLQRAKDIAACAAWH